MIELLYQNREIVIAIKPAGISAQSTPQKDGLPDLLSHQLATPCHSVHRLDLAVGGVMLLAKSKEAMAKYSAMMQTQQIIKRYLCITDGAVRDASGELFDYLYHDARANRSYVVDSMRKGVKDARLTYARLASDDDTSLLCVTLQTGRTHQIRVQFSSRKTPLWGDGKYGSRKKGAIALWSYSLTIQRNGQTQTFCALPIPKEPWTNYQEYLASLVSQE